MCGEREIETEKDQERINLVLMLKVFLKYLVVLGCLSDILFITENLIKICVHGSNLADDNLEYSVIE